MILKTAKHIIRGLIGVVFIISAVFKLISIDDFEVYVYSFGYLNLNFTLIFVRILIAFEMLLAVLLLLGIYTKYTVWISITSLIIFTGFIASLILKNETEHCHCFGSQIEMNHITSIIKNVVLIVLLFFVRNSEDILKKYKKHALILLSVSSIATVGFISPPDNLLRETYDKKTTYSETNLNEFINSFDDDLANHMLVFMSPKCGFCELASQKLEVVLAKSNSENRVEFIFWGQKKDIIEFLNEHNLTEFPHSIIPPNKFLKITDGKMPLILLLENNNKVSRKYGYRNLNEKEIIEFFNN